MKTRNQVTRMLVLFVLAHWGHHLLSSVIAPLLPFIRTSLNIDVVQAGSLVSAFTIAYGVSQLPAGWLADRLGRRILILLGISGVALWGILVGIAPGYWALIILMVLMGLFGGGYHPSSAPLVSSVVAPQRRGWALGIHQIGGTLSNLTAPLIAAGLATYLGWQTAFFIPGGVVFILGIVLFMLLRGIKPAGKPEPDHGQTQTQLPGKPHNLSKIITYVVLGTAGQVFLQAAISFLPLYMVDHLGEQEGIAAALIFVVYLGGMPAGPLAGYISDRVGAHRLLIIAGIATGPIIYLLSLVTSIWFTIPVILVIGALLFTLMPVSEVYIINQTREANRSTILGVYYAVSRGGSGFLILGLGYLIERYGFGSTFAATGGAVLAIAIICSVIVLIQNRKS